MIIQYFDTADIQSPGNDECSSTKFLLLLLSSPRTAGAAACCIGADVHLRDALGAGVHALQEPADAHGAPVLDEQPDLRSFPPPNMTQNPLEIRP